MSRSRRGRRLLPLVAAVAVLLAACGDGDATREAADRAATTSTTASSGSRPVDPAEGLRLADREGAVVLDVRTPQEFADGHLEGARNLPLAGDFAAAVADLPRDGGYVLYCRTGNRSAQAARIMVELGFTDVSDAGGLAALAAAGGRVVT